MNWLIILLIGIIIGLVLAALYEYSYRQEAQARLYRDEYESRITTLNSELAALQAQLSASNSTLSGQTAEMESLKAELTAKTEALEDCSARREKAEAETEYLRGLLEEADSKLASLEGKGSDLNADSGVDIEVDSSDASMVTAAPVDTPDHSVSVDTPRFKWFDWDFDFSGWGEGDDVELTGQGMPGGSVDVNYQNSLIGSAEVSERGAWSFPFKVPGGFSLDFLNFTGRNANGVEVDDVAIDLALSDLDAEVDADVDVDIDVDLEAPAVDVDLPEAEPEANLEANLDVDAEPFTPITPELAARLGIPAASDEEKRLFDWGKFNFLDWKFGDEQTLDGEGDVGGSVDVSYRGDLVGTAPVEESGRWEQAFNVPAGFAPGYFGIFGRNAEGDAVISTIGTQAVELGVTADSVREEKESTGDDFTRFWGIGPKIEALLHGRGFNRYSQLADASQDDVKAVIKEAKVSKSRLPEDPHMVWTSQARLAAADDWDGVAAFIDTNRRDDLKLIWGIGPKIEGLLNNKGIYTFAKLSRMLPEDINTIINEAGTRFVLSPDRLHSSWIEQAHVADIEDWDEFNRIKDSLSWKNIS